MQIKPILSIITPVYNCVEFIEYAILSVINQKIDNLEYIIIDGGSTDGTVEIIKKYEKYITYWESTPDRGQTHALNKGFERATGVFRGWLNADEEYTPGALEIIIEVIKKNKHIDLIYGNRSNMNMMEK